jgi:hypothetical protein
MNPDGSLAKAEIHLGNARNRSNKLSQLSLPLDVSPTR